MKEGKRTRQLYIRCSTEFIKLLQIITQQSAISNSDLLHKVLGGYALREYTPYNSRHTVAEVVELAKVCMNVRDVKAAETKRRQIDREQKIRARAENKRRYHIASAELKHSTALHKWQELGRFKSGSITYSKKSNYTAGENKLRELQRRIELARKF